MLRSTGSQRVGHDLATEQQQKKTLRVGSKSLLSVKSSLFGAIICKSLLNDDRDKARPEQRISQYLCLGQEKLTTLDILHRERENKKGD